MPIGATLTMELLVCVLPRPISSAPYQQARTLPISLWELVALRLTDFILGNSTANHLSLYKACLERRDQLASCGYKLQSLQQQEVSPEILQSGSPEWPDIISDKCWGEYIARGPFYIQKRFPSSERQYKTQKWYVTSSFRAKGCKFGIHTTDIG